MAEEGKDRAEIAEEVRRHAPDGWIACESAMALAKQLNIGNTELGEILNEQKIKLVKCQFGCF